MAAVGAGEQGGGNVRGFEGGFEFGGLGVGDDGVLVPVDDEEGGIVRGDVGHGRGLAPGLLAVFERAAEELGHGTLGVFGVSGAAFAAEGEEVGGAAEVEHAGDAAALVQVLAEVSLQLLHAAGDAEHADEVAAGGDAENGDLVGVEIVFLGMGAQPAYGGLAVVDLGRPGALVGEAVVEAGPGVGSAVPD